MGVDNNFAFIQHFVHIQIGIQTWRILVQPASGSFGFLSGVINRKHVSKHPGGMGVPISHSPQANKNPLDKLCRIYFYPAENNHSIKEHSAR